MVSVSYSKVNEDGDVIYLDEETALKEAEAANEFQEANLMNQMSGIATASYDIDVSLDSYMKITYSVSINGEVCESIVIGEWLTMPAFRGYDSIGACAKYMTITPNTAECTIYYDQTVVKNGKMVTGNVTKSITDIKTDTENGWAGIAAVFNLPNDSRASAYFALTTNLTAIFKYQGKIEFPEQRLNFNAVGTYSHTTLGISLGSPGVSINQDGADVSIGMSIAAMQEKRSVLLEIQYTP